MERLQFAAVHEDGQHLVLSTSDGTEFLLPVDERLRSALRNRGPAADLPAAQLSPRDVQAMIRVGQTATEVAELTGWPVERVARFEAPITAEREHVAGLARAAHVRGRATEGVVPTLETRVLERLEARGVDPDNTSWDATRPAGGTWTVVVNFVAGQRQRAAAWRFEPADRTVEALDDEARWLSEDEQSLPGSAAGKQLLGSHGVSEEVDLVTSMRERSRTRSRRKRPTPRGEQPAALAPEKAPGKASEDVLPLEHVTDDQDRTDQGPSDPTALSPGDEGTSTQSPTPDQQARDQVAPEQDASETASGAETAPVSDGPKPRRAKTGRSKSGRARSGRSKASAPESATGSAADDASTRSTRKPKGPAGTTGSGDPGASAVSYDVELDFDDDYEVDPTPQEATLTDLFGPGDTPSEEVPADVYFDDDADDVGPSSPEGHDGTDDADAEGGSTEGGSTEGGGPDADSTDGPVAPTSGQTSAEDGAESLAFDNDDVEPGQSDPTPADTAVSDSPAVEAPTAETGAADNSDEDAGEIADEAATGAEQGGTPGEEAEDPPQQAQESSQPGAKRRKDGRPGVPSWDDIMFGAKDRK